MRLINADALMSQAFSTRQGYDAVLIEDIVNAPTVEAEPVKHGRWIIIDDVEKFLAKCSECGRVEDTRLIEDYPYCHCGAKMDGGK